MDERINSEHFNLDLKGQSLFIYPWEGRGVVDFGGGIKWFLWGTEGGYTEYKGGTVEN